MGRREIYLDYKKGKHKYVDTSIRNRGILNGKIAKDIKNKNPNWKYNIDDLTRGQKWFESGLSLDDANDEDKNNDAFVAGFNKGKRIQFVNQQLYELGKEYFERGDSLENIPETYKNNEYFMSGYLNSVSKKNR